MYQYLSGKIANQILSLHISGNQNHYQILSHHVTEQGETLNSFFILFQSLIHTHPHYSISVSICISSFILLSILIHTYLHFSISSYHLSFLILFIIPHFIHYSLDLLYLVLDLSRFLYLIFISIFISDFVLQFHWYFVC